MANTVKDIIDGMIQTNASLSELRLCERCNKILGLFQQQFLLGRLNGLSSKEITVKVRLNQRTAIRHLEEHLRAGGVVINELQEKKLKDGRVMEIQVWKVRDAPGEDYRSAMGGLLAPSEVCLTEYGISSWLESIISRSAETLAMHCQ